MAVRSRYPKDSLADLYDPNAMPTDLRAAHENLDKLVDVAFGAPHWLRDDDTERIRILFQDYQKLTAQQK